MNAKLDNSSLRDLFARRQDNSREPAPSFDELWSRAETERSRLALRRRRITAGMAALVVLALALRMLTNRTPGQPPVVNALPATQPSRWIVAAEPAALPWQSQVLVSQWRAPSDFLSDEFANNQNFTLQF